MLIENRFYFFGNQFLNLFIFVIFVKEITEKLPNVMQN